MQSNGSSDTSQTPIEFIWVVHVYYYASNYGNIFMYPTPVLPTQMHTYSHAHGNTVSRNIYITGSMHYGVDSKAKLKKII